MPEIRSLDYERGLVNLATASLNFFLSPFCCFKRSWRAFSPPIPDDARRNTAGEYLESSRAAMGTRQ